MQSDARRPMRRPMLKTGLRRLHRGPGAVQFGADPERAVVLADLDGPAADLLADLGDRPAQLRHPELLDRLAALGLLEDGKANCPGWRALPHPLRDRLAPDLASLGLLDPGPHGGRRELSHRFAAQVEIRGAGRVGATLASLLAAAGVGEVRTVDDGPTRPLDLAPAGLRAEHLGMQRGRAAAPAPLPAPTLSAARRARRRAGLPAPRRKGPTADVVVLTSDAGVPARADDLWTERVPHLVAQVQETSGTVGPLVVPGTSACLRCLDLARGERDPQWASLTAQLTVPSEPEAVAACDVVLATAVASHAALQVLTFLDTGSATTLDGTLHLRLPDGILRRRSWQPHPACGCTWAR
ncbi:MAG: ThiF family adenylyltransferase [Sporichthyaceae bacterium]